MIKFNPVTYLEEVKIELEKVSWPSRQQTLNMTLVVVAVSLVIGLYLGVLDYLLVRAQSFIFA